MIAAALVVLAVGVFYFVRARSSATQINSIAVLPFVNATADPNNDYLSDGLTESLIGTLSRLSNLKVMARSTVFKFKGKEDDPRQIGQTLQGQRRAHRSHHAARRPDGRSSRPGRYQRW
jgi:hypothetical protein